MNLTPTPRFVSVILSTFNQVAWLEKSLAGFLRQCFRDFEIIIADDGSDHATADLIDRICGQTDLTIRHVWHEDDGFRKSQILNRATAVADGDYLVYSDGDCIPRDDFVGQHVNAAEIGRFCSGGYYKLPMDLSKRITIDDIAAGSCFRHRWLRNHGLPFSHRNLRLMRAGRTSRILNRLTTTRPTWNGNNSSGWKSDIIAAGGFDQRMRYGGQDRELGERLENAGIPGKHVRFQTLTLHLDHERGYANADDRRRNQEIRRQTRRSGRTRTDYGLRAA